MREDDMNDSLSRLTSALASRYTIERELGRGGMAVVYLAQDLKHERQVAVKVLRPELAASIGADRFQQEIKIAANLNHPHILPLLDSGESDGFLFFVMPYIEGESLRDKLANEGELPINDAVRILREVVDALAHAHEQGVVHRDIKPDNVVLSGRHALVTDFGVAKAVSEATGSIRITTEGVALGTPAYMSPEQAAADPQIDHRADIYAVGVIAYELLTGRTPFVGNTQQELLAAHVTQTPDPVTKYRESVPPALAELVMQCLEKKAADRWQTAEELLPQLEALATPSGGVKPITTVPDGDARDGWKLAVAIGVAASLLVVVLVVVLLPGGSGVGLDPQRVLVVAYADESGSEESQSLGRMAQDYIIQSLTEAGFAEVVDPITALAVSQNVAAASTAEGPGEILAMADEARAGTVVYGAFYAEGDSLSFQTRISDARDGSLMGSVGPIVGARSARRDLVARVGLEVVAALAPLLDRELVAWEPLVQPATYESYEAYNQGLEAYFRNDFAEAAPHFEHAVDVDSTFYRARLWAAQSQVLLRGSHVAKAESLVAPLVEFRGQLGRYERCRLDFVIALGIRPNKSAGYDAARCMLQAAPGSDDARREVANFTLYSYRYREGIRLLSELDPDRGLMKQWWPYWTYLGRAYYRLADYEGALEVSQQGRQRFPESLPILAIEASALAALDRPDDVDAIVEEMRSLPSRERLGRELGAVAVSLRTHGHPDAAQEVLDESITWYLSRPHQTEQVRSELLWWLFVAERWDDAQLLAQAIAEEYPEDPTYLAALGIGAAVRGDREEALRISEELRAFRDPWLVPVQALGRARIAALVGDREEATTLLRQALELDVNMSYGVWGVRPEDMFFESLRDYAPFQELMRPKG